MSCQFTALLDWPSLVQAKTFGETSSFSIARKVAGFAPGVTAPPAAGGLLPLPPWFAATCHGNLSPLSLLKTRNAKPTCFRLLMQVMRWALAFALANAGRS